MRTRPSAAAESSAASSPRRSRRRPPAAAPTAVHLMKRGEPGSARRHQGQQQRASRLRVLQRDALPVPPAGSEGRSFRRCRSDVIQNQIVRRQRRRQGENHSTSGRAAPLRLPRVSCSPTRAVDTAASASRPEPPGRFGSRGDLRRRSSSLHAKTAIWRCMGQRKVRPRGDKIRAAPRYPHFS